MVGFGVQAQDSATKKTDSVMDKSMEDHITSKNGKLWFIKGSQTSELKMDVTLKDGTIVMPTGTVKKADGSSIILEEGWSIYMDGMIRKPD